MNNSDNQEQSLISASSVLELKRLDFRARKQVDAQISGAFKSTFKGSGLTFSDYREYQPGDDVRHIHWKASARTGRTYVKDYEEERQCTFMLMVDGSLSTEYGSTKKVSLRIKEFSALIALLARKNRDRLGLAIFDDTLKSFLPAKAATRLHYQVAIHNLLNFQSNSSNTNLSTAIENFLKLPQKKSVIFIISDFHISDFKDKLRLLAIKHDVILVKCSDPYELQLPKVGLTLFKDAESGKVLAVDTSSGFTNSTLAKIAKTRNEDLIKIARQANCDFIELTDNPLQSLRELVKLRSKKR